MNADAPTSLSDRASRAAVWASALSMFMRFSAIFTQLTLAWFLIPEDFGVYAKAATVFTLARLCHKGGIQEVLVKRQRGFRVWANAGFWMMLTFGVIGSAVTIAIAPLATSFFRTARSEELTRLIRVFGLVFPLMAAGGVCRARMQIEMRFKDLAWTGGLYAGFDALLKITLAALGFGAMSFGYGTVIAAAFHLVICWYYAPVPIKLNPQFRRWKYLFGDGVMVVFALFGTWLIEEGDYLVLGRYETDAVVGVYFFAYRIGHNSMTVLTNQLAKVLFPALASVPSRRRTNAFVRATRLLSLMSIHMCFMIAATASPVFRLAFSARWQGAILLVQIMCSGMALRTLTWPATSLLQAQGRFRTKMLLSFAAVIIFFPAAIAGTLLGSAVGLAITLAVFHSCMAIVDLFVALSLDDDPVQKILSIVWVPLLANLLSVVPALLVAYGLLPQLGIGDPWLAVSQLFVIGVLGVGLYALAIRFLDRVLWETLTERIKRTFLRRRTSA